MIAVEVGPVAPEYQTENCERPIIFYRDARGLYDEETARRLAEAARDAGIDVQHALVASFGSDASISSSYGNVANAACIGFPTENTHGYEIASLSGLENTAKVLTQFLSAAS